MMTMIFTKNLAKNGEIRMLNNVDKADAILIIGRFAFLLSREFCGWPRSVESKYGLAISYWKKSEWRYGLRFSLLLGNRRPFARVTTYSCPSIGSECVVKPLSCVI